jgi:diguanylate cyclase (GGDEF)-like protein
MSIIDGTLPSAMVVADSPCQVLVLDAKIVWALIDRSPVVARNLLHILSTRVRRNNLALVRSHAQQRIHERNALHDSLTGLYNRRWMESKLVRIVERSAHNQQPLALLLIDVDYFKRYNDEHGHLSGDQLLTSVARMLTKSVRSEDYVCRYGGDEFAVVLPQTGPAEALPIAQRVCDAVREYRIQRGERLLEGSISVSVGIGFLRPNMTMRQLLASADAALYNAKTDGRDRVSH